MKNVILAVVLMAVSSLTFAADTEYKLTRIQYTASDGVRYDTVNNNLHIIDSQAAISSRAFWMKAEIVNGNYLPGERDVFEKYRYRISADGVTLRLVNSLGEKSTARILRASPLRIEFDTGVTLNFRQVGYTGRDRNPQITTLQTIDQAIDDSIANDLEIGPIGL